MARSRRWCFTDFAVVEVDDFPNCTYLVVGKEVCPNTGKDHWQGYVEFANARTLGGVKKMLPFAHWEPAKGSAADNLKYCSKENDMVVLYGFPSQQGERTDLGKVRDMVQAGDGMRQIAMVATSYQALRGAELLLKWLEPPRAPDQPVQVFWYWGPTGTGKTHAALAEAGEDTWWASRDLRWFEGYDGHECAIFDDFRAGWIRFTELLRLLDKYQYRTENKGGCRQWKPKRIFITCPCKPEDAYRGRTEEDLEQLKRRISCVKHFALRFVHPGTE